MAKVEQKPSGLACVGMLAGLLLLGFAGTLLVMSPTLQKEVASLAARRLQPVGVQQVAAQPLPVVPMTNQAGLLISGQDQQAGSLDRSATSMDESGSGSSGSSFRQSKSLDSKSGSSDLSHSFDSMPAGMEEAGGYWIFVGSSNLGTLLLMIIFAVCYYHNAVAPIIMTKGTLAMRGFHYTGKDDFDNGIFGCFDDVWVLIHGCCCPLVRMSHTNAVAGVMGYWESAICWCCCAALTGGLGPMCLMVYWRKQLKDIMGLEDHLVNDICLTFFCWPLSIIQQGIAVDHASGYEVTGCCTLEWSGHHQP